MQTGPDRDRLSAAEPGAALGTSWTHVAARRVVRPLLGTWVRPNHLTVLRLLSGLGACACFAVGSRAGTGWGGVAWVVSAFLDRADGELARAGSLGTAWGHMFDYYVDNAVNTAFFVSIGVGLRHGWLGCWAEPLGLLSGASFLLGNVLSEWLELRGPPGARAYSGRWGFDPDDALYLMGPLAWLGLLGPTLVGAAIGTTTMMLITGVRLMILARRQGPV